MSDDKTRETIKAHNAAVGYTHIALPLSKELLVV